MSTLSRRELLTFSGSKQDLDPLIHIVSLLVQATEPGCASVRNLLEKLPGAELHETRGAGKLAIVLECADSRAIAAAANELQQLSGVLTVSIVAHLTERASALDETHEPTTVPAQ